VGQFSMENLGVSGLLLDGNQHSPTFTQGRAGLEIREWVCCECGAAQERDANTAKNTLAAGHRRLAAAIAVPAAQEAASS